MNIYLFLFAFVVAILFALLEIQIEGGDGWAARLPTWRVRNPFKRLINWPYLTGYHLYLNLLFMTVLQVPFFFGVPFTLRNELLVLELFLIIMTFEDFFWFALNPKWGIKRFFTEDIPWHAGKLLFLPRNYWISFVALAVIEVIHISV